MSTRTGAVRAIWGALISLVVLLPGIAGLTSVAIYAIVPGDQRGFAWLVPIAGFAVALAGLLSVAVVAQSFARFGGAHSLMATDLTTRLDALKADRGQYCGPTPSTPLSDAQKAACAAVATYESFLTDRIAPDSGEVAGPEWTSGSGYIGLWMTLHRAEEAMMLVAPKEVIVSNAVYDQSRLSGSNIADARQLLATSRAALTHIASQTTDAATSARGELAGVRKVVNEYRDGLSTGLLELRGRLNMSVLFVGLTGYAALTLAMMAGVASVNILAGAAFYLSGVMVGLLQVVYNERNLKTQVDDYGVATARKVHLSLISGMAGVAGAALAALLAPAPLGLSLLSASGNVDILAAFDLQRYPAGLLAAAIFGLTPGLLLRRLREAGNSLTLDLEKSSAGAGASTDEQGT